MAYKTETVERIRRFNRFYTACIRVMDKTYLDSEFSLTESRILYELGANRGCTAQYLSDKLNIDKGYMSRILKKFKEKGFLERRGSESDRRAYCLTLTKKGQEITNELNRRSDAEIGALLAGLSERECEDICRAMDVITEHLPHREELEWK